MKEYFKSRMSEASTYRGLIWIIVSIVGLYNVTHNESIDDLMVLAAAAVGGLGLTKDKT